MTNRIHRKLFVAALLLGATTALTACGTGAATKATAGSADRTAPITKTTDTPPNAPAIAEPTSTQQPTTAAPAQQPANAPRANDGCPVSQATLLDLANNWDRLAPTEAVEDIDCYKGWATAGQIVSKKYIETHGQVQPAMILFQYSPGHQTWFVDAVGHNDICPTDMPADVKKHFGKKLCQL